ncbi:MAG: glutaredoxin family protein [Dehalococcoidia bacterium]
MDDIVNIYTSTGCKPCEMVKNFFSKKGIKFIEHNISLDQDSLEFLLNKGLMTTPVTFVGDEFVVGYNTTKLELMLNNIN